MAEGLQPVVDLNGNNNNGWGSGWGALAGGAIGGAVGSAWGRNGNNGNCGCGCNGSNQFIMDSITTMRSDINSIGRDNLIQACTGFGTTVAAVERVGAAQALATSRNEAAILTSSLQAQLGAKDNTYAIVSSQKDCCCQTQRLIEAEGCATRQAIHAEGEATRGLITANTIQQLRDEKCELQAQLATCQAQRYADNLAVQTQNTIIAAVRAMIPTTTTTTPTTTA